MNVTQIKGLTWLTAAGLTAGLFYYVFTSFTELKSRPQPFQEGSTEYARATEILNRTYESDGQQIDVVALADVQRTFNELNWTGKEPPPPPKVQVEQKPVEVPKTPVADLLRVFYVQEDVDRPEESTAFVRYRDKAGVQGAPKDGYFLAVGDRLLSPHAYARVVAIDTEGVRFGFDEEGREEELVLAPQLPTGGPIPLVSEDGVILPQGIPIRAYEGTRPPVTRQTTMIGRNHYALGTEDMFLLADDYPTIIAREVRHRRHKDPKTGKYDGIELQEVEAGGTISRHGGESGDVIKSINGTPVTSMQEAVTYVNNNRDTYTTWEVVVENRGQVRTVTYESPPTQP